MRITAPGPEERADLDHTDLADVALYTSGDPHLAWQRLRAEQPLYWSERTGGPGFWSVTRHADVKRVLRDHENFTSECGTALWQSGTPDPAAGRMMHGTDPPAHGRIRKPLGHELTTQAVLRYEPAARALIRAAVEPGEWDCAPAFSRLPMEILALVMGLPKADVDLLADLGYASIAPLDPHYRTGSERVTRLRAHHQLMAYFADEIGRPREDGLIAHLQAITVDGRPLTSEEVVLNCFSLLIGGVVTSGQVVLATLIALAERGGRVPAVASTATAVEEALRWASPTTHFVRHARRDVEMYGRTIRAGEAVAAWIASANRDEREFAHPFTFDPARSPNRHIAFGSGSHRCIGSHLARFTLRLVFEEFIDRLDHIELTAPPTHLSSIEIAGVVSLPVHLKLRQAGRTA
ncbi:cytochrome P450 [Nonomuraea guangzhouensis]|uniref:Cytochrome P450 n=1 Tax=Nonomuraea guangzhouensis TaxID=1291555 RepID=A0ABW4GY18_9ACTN|nr:cytochrome P450 [Nonomuraea guangzhouensis]